MRLFSHSLASLTFFLIAASEIPFPFFLHQQIKQINRFTSSTQTQLAFKASSLLGHLASHQTPPLQVNPTILGGFDIFPLFDFIRKANNKQFVETNSSSRTYLKDNYKFPQHLCTLHQL